MDAYRLNRVLVEVAGWPGATLKCAVQGDDPTGVMAIAREMTGSNKSFQAGRWERDGIGAVGAAFIVRLDWDGGSVRSPLSNLQAFVKMQGKGHQ